MTKDLTFEEWATEYPPDTAASVPEDPLFVTEDDTLDSYAAAENFRDFREESDDLAYRTVLCNGKFYVVSIL